MFLMIDSGTVNSAFTDREVSDFQTDGFLIQRNLIPPTYIAKILDIASRDAAMHYGDIEYEAQVKYPGAPQSMEAEGGRTIRRLKQAFSRDPVFSQLVKEPFLLTRLQQLLGPQVVMPLAHHNCIMTKQPQFSSDTGWHRDVRYWAFESPELVNIWIALGEETLDNGCLKLLPGTHRASLQPHQFDEDLFFREDIPDNRPLLDSAVTAELKAGDVLFFHAQCFHSATRNYSEQTKYSAVFTFRSLDNAPLSGTRSSALPELLLSTKNG
ncbi:MAG: phytanoyl-CoA dioxygenase family protein [Planctomycetaceae bacterium]|nr:phytanoyl-CoA dioxygenase family protein [Planctomycetaceae bacterium]